MALRISLCALFLLLTPIAPSLHGAERLTMTVSPVHSFAPATVRVLVRLEPSADNRALEIVADSGDFYRSSLIALEGERGPRVVRLDLRSLPGGDYEIRGVLSDGLGHERAVVCQQANVISTGMER